MLYNIDSWYHVSTVYILSKIKKKIKHFQLKITTLIFAVYCIGVMKGSYPVCPSRCRYKAVKVFQRLRITTFSLIHSIKAAGINHARLFDNLI